MVRVSQQDLKLESILSADTAGDARSHRRTRVAYAEKNWRNAVWTPRDAENKQRDARPSVLSQTSSATNYKLPRIKSMVITTTTAAVDLGENSPLFTITYAQSLLRRCA